MKIGGIIDLSTKDIPGRACMVFFTVGCNFNCEFCHNKHLLRNDAGREYSIEELLNLVKSNFLVSAISITGGEPTLYEDLITLCAELKKLERFISVDTNGSRPAIVEKLLPNIDRIALDLKGPLIEKRYVEITKTPINLNLLIKTIDLINQNKYSNFEIRTTYVNNLLNSNDIQNIISFLKNQSFSGNFVLQQYQYSNGVGEKFKEKFQKPEHITLLNVLKPYLSEELPFQIYLRDDIVGYSEIHEVFQKIL